MGESKHDGLVIPGQVVLAHEPDFRLVGLTVRPATRQVERDGRSETLEPRVMQVLVTLGRANPAIVTRDELIDRCWQGRIVTDDAVNRVLSRVRQVAAGIGGGSFHVETIPRVGYRLVTAESSSRSRAPALRPSRRKLLVGLGGGVLTAAAATGGWLLLSTSQDLPPEARLLYERAYALRFTGFPADNRQAMAYLKEAVRIAPDYGEAWGALALAYRSVIRSEPPERAEGFRERLEEAARNADRYDPGNADAAAARLPLQHHFGRWAEFERLFRAAIRRHPRHSTAYYALGSLLMDVGRWQDAAEALATAGKLNAFAPLVSYKLAVSLWSAGRISEAEDEIDSALDRWPQHSAIWQTKLKMLALTGRASAALRLADDPANRPIDEPPDLFENRRSFLTALITRRDDDVRAAVQSTLAIVRRIRADALPSAISCAALGQTAQSLDLLEGVFLGEGPWAEVRPAEGEDRVTHPLFQPPCRPLWSERRFQRLLSTIGLEGYWRQTGTRPDYRQA